MLGESAFGKGKRDMYHLCRMNLSICLFFPYEQVQDAQKGDETPVRGDSRRLHSTFLRPLSFSLFFSTIFEKQVENLALFWYNDPTETKKKRRCPQLVWIQPLAARRNAMNELIAKGLADLNLPTDAAPALARYGMLLVEQNQVMNLTAITDPVQVARLHMLDCAAILQAADLTGGKRLLDVGTGAGFPGMVLKLVQPELDLTLLDSLDKRIQWLTRLAPELGAEGVRAVHGRAEELAVQPEWREQFDVVTSRAVADLRMLCELCLPFVKVGGVFLAMKAEDCTEEVNAASRAVSLLGGRLLPAYSYTIPGTNVTRKVVRIQKEKETPAKYPRRFSKMKKQPL